MDLTGEPVSDEAGSEVTNSDRPEAAVVFVLATLIPSEGSNRPAYLLHNVGGVDCVLGYTSLEKLVRCCGEHQPWLAVRLDALMTDMRNSGLAGPAIDLPLDRSTWWTAEGPPWDLPALIAAAQGQ